jgi:hypothetical protein
MQAVTRVVAASVLAIAIAGALTSRLEAVSCVCACSNGCEGSLMTTVCTEQQNPWLEGQTKVKLAITCGGQQICAGENCFANNSEEIFSLSCGGCTAKAYPKPGFTWGTVTSCNHIGGGCS